jgi:hypothetical protein
MRPSPTGIGRLELQVQSIVVTLLRSGPYLAADLPLTYSDEDLEP